MMKEILTELDLRQYLRYIPKRKRYILIYPDGTAVIRIQVKGELYVYYPKTKTEIKRLQQELGFKIVKIITLDASFLSQVAQKLTAKVVREDEGQG